MQNYQEGFKAKKLQTTNFKLQNPKRTGQELLEKLLINQYLASTNEQPKYNYYIFNDLIKRGQ
jgi:hypothetical protein